MTLERREALLAALCARKVYGAMRIVNMPDMTLDGWGGTGSAVGMRLPVGHVHEAEVGCSEGGRGGGGKDMRSEHSPAAAKLQHRGDRKLVEVCSASGTFRWFCSNRKSVRRLIEVVSTAVGYGLIDEQVVGDWGR